MVALEQAAGAGGGAHVAPWRGEGIGECRAAAKAGIKVEVPVRENFMRA